MKSYTKSADEPLIEPYHSKIDVKKGMSVKTDWGTLINNGNWLDFASSVESLPDYLREMDELSQPNMLNHWWTNEAGAAAKGFTNGLPKNTHFCALSSLGHQPVWKNEKFCLERKPEPFRVRDPLFWIFREAGIM